MEIGALLFLICLAAVAPIRASESGYAQALRAIAAEIEALKPEYPQLESFFADRCLDPERLAIEYGLRTHRPAPRAGWTSGVPNPDPNGIWFYIDFHDPASTAQIHTQPVVSTRAKAGAKEVFMLALEGTATRPVTGLIWERIRRLVSGTAFPPPGDGSPSASGEFQETPPSGTGREAVESLPVETGMPSVGIRWFSRFNLHFSIDLGGFQDSFICDGPWMVEPPGAILGTYFPKLPASVDSPAAGLQAVIVFKDCQQVAGTRPRTLGQLVDLLKEGKRLVPFPGPEISGTILAHSREVQSSTSEDPSTAMVPRTMWNLDFHGRIKGKWLQIQFSALFPPGTPLPESLLKKVQAVLATVRFRSPPASSREALETALAYLASIGMETSRYEMEKPESIGRMKVEGRQAWRIAWKLKDFDGKGGQLVIVVQADGNCQLGWGE